MPHHDTGERAEQHAFDQRQRLRESRRSRPECARDPAHEPARNQQRPALDVDRADEGSEDGRREHEPRRRVAEGGSRHARDEERRNTELRNRRGAAALRTDMNGSNAVDDRTTRMGCRGGMGEKGAIERDAGHAANRMIAGHRCQRALTGAFANREQQTHLWW
jgi:hypothetical protein